ncbi:MAG: aspartate:alanine exchanger family transporter, partial [Gemmatimonadales bacterium]
MIVEALRSHPEIALFLCLALGYVIGKVKVGGHALGLVTGSLFAGLFIGQLEIDISPAVKTVAFLLFLFGNGYSAGPQFMRALKQDGVRPLILTLVVTLAGLAAVYVMSRLLNLETGFTAGLLSGALTQSAAMGTATEAINGLAITDAEKVRLANQVPVADAVCYLFGFWGEVLFVVVAGPKLLGINLQKEAKALEAKLGLRDESAGASAYKAHRARAYRVETAEAVGRSIAQLEAWAKEQTQRRIFALRLRRGDAVLPAALDTVLDRGDVVVLGGPAERLVPFGPRIGAEVDDATLLDFPVEALDVVLTARELDGMTIQAAAERWGESRGVFLRRLSREGLELPRLPGTRLNRGDVATLVGPEDAVEALTVQIGVPDRKTTTTDFLTVGLGIAVGCLIGLPAIVVGNVSLALSTSVGTLIAGLFFGWLRS